MTRKVLNNWWFCCQIQCDPGMFHSTKYLKLFMAIFKFNLKFILIVSHLSHSKVYVLWFHEGWFRWTSMRMNKVYKYKGHALIMLHWVAKASSITIFCDVLKGIKRLEEWKDSIFLRYWFIMHLEPYNKVIFILLNILLTTVHNMPLIFVVLHHYLSHISLFYFQYWIFALEEGTAK